MTVPLVFNLSYTVFYGTTVLYLTFQVCTISTLHTLSSFWHDLASLTCLLMPFIISAFHRHAAALLSSTCGSKRSPGTLVNFIDCSTLFWGLPKFAMLCNRFLLAVVQEVEIGTLLPVQWFRCDLTMIDCLRLLPERNQSYVMKRFPHKLFCTFEGYAIKPTFGSRLQLDNKN